MTEEREGGSKLCVCVCVCVCERERERESSTMVVVDSLVEALKRGFLIGYKSP